MARNYVEWFVDFVKKNKFLCLVFLLSTLFLFFQHYKHLTWDFSSYVLNAKYLFYGGSYFEILRPPLVSVILGLFLFLGTMSQYIFILITSLLFFIATVVLSDTIFREKSIKKETARFLFYFFSLSAYVLSYAVIAGTELLSLSFLYLFIAFVLKKKVSGHFLGLGILARYNLFMFVPFLFFSKSYKIILKNIGLAFLVLAPWLLFNYFKYGNFMASIIDSLTLNILNRDYLFEPFILAPLFAVIGVFLPFFLVGLILAIKRIIKNKGYRYENIVLLLIVFLVLYDFITNPQKDVRFLFNLILPVAYFSTLGFCFLINRFKNVEKVGAYSVLALFVIFLVMVFGLFYNTNNLDPRIGLKDAADDIYLLKLENCEILSPSWVSVSYYTENVYPFHDGSIKDLVEQNKTILIFKDENSIDFSIRNFDNFKDLVLYETEEYVFYSNGPDNCAEKYVYDIPYTRYEFCPNLARKFEKFGLKESFEKICFIFNKN